MPDIWLDVDTAVIVPVNIMPLLDDSDFKSIEVAIVYNSAGIAITWNFVTTAGVVSGTAITPTTGGVYDWSEPIADKGMYAIELPASGGASVDNDTEGVGWITGVVNGVLPWRGPTIGFRAAAINNSLIDGAGIVAASVTGAVGSVTGDVGGNVDGTIGGLHATAKGHVNTECLDVLATDTHAEPGQGTPAATASLKDKIGYLYKFLRNKNTQTATLMAIYNDDASTVDHKSTVSDDGTTATRGEFATGP